MSAAYSVGRNRSVWILLTAAAVASAVSCTSSSGGGGDEDNGHNSASCVNRVTYEKRIYKDLANVTFKTGGRLGTVSSVPCDDTGNRDGSDEPVTKSTAYAVKGLDTDIAIAVGDTPDEAVFFTVDSGKKLPAEVKKLIKG